MEDIILGEPVIEKANEAGYDIGTIIDVQFTTKMLDQGPANYLVLKIKLDDGREVTEQMKISYRKGSKFYEFNKGLVDCGVKSMTLSELKGAKFKFKRMRSEANFGGVQKTIFYRVPVEYLGKVQTVNTVSGQTMQITELPPVSANNTVQVQQTPTYTQNQTQQMNQQISQPYVSQPVATQQQVSTNTVVKSLPDRIYEIVVHEPTYINDLATKLSVSIDEIRQVVATDPRLKILNDVVYA